MTVGAIPAIPALVPLEHAGTAASAGTAGAGSVSFSHLLADKIGGAIDLQNQADAAAQAVASGTSTDLAGATVAVEKAAITSELVGQVRNKAVEAYQEIMRMQM